MMRTKIELVITEEDGHLTLDYNREDNVDRLNNTKVGFTIPLIDCSNIAKTLGTETALRIAQLEKAILKAGAEHHLELHKPNND